MLDNLSKMKTPADRIKYIREKLLKLSRAEVHKKYELSADTLIAWENGKNQITDKGIERIIKIYNAENIIVSREWILTGTGLAPNFSFDLNRYFKNLDHTGDMKNIDDNILLAKEIDFFRSQSSNAVTGLISQDDMLPLYARGDYVGGKFRSDKELDSCIGKDCIIKTKNGATYIRRLAKAVQGEGYNLICLNPQWGGNPEPVIHNAEVECAAPIIWHRRLDD